MWGGPCGDDLAVVFDGDIVVYRGYGQIGNVFQVIKNPEVEAQNTVLQKGLQHLGLVLPERYFALHARKFAWGSYVIFHRGEFE